MLKYLGRVTIARGLSIILVCTVAWLWLALREVRQPTAPPIAQNQPEPVRSNATTCPAPKPPPKTVKLSQSLFPVSDPDSWVGENNKVLRALFKCMELSNCRRNQKKVVILGSYHFLGAYWNWNGGEDIWARSTIQALRNMGYTFLYANSNDRIVQLYHMIGDMVKAILVEGPESRSCFEDDEHCRLSWKNPEGIPAWKIFSFSFWTHPDNPLGRKWTLSPEEYAREGHEPNYFLGYSVEPSCLSKPMVSQEDREDYAYIMTKHLFFMEAGNDQAWPPHFYEEASKTLGIRFAMGANDDGENIELPAGVTNLGQLPQPEFLDVMSKALVLIGVGRPVTSPTPYEALCLGVPFINPILDWDRAQPGNRMKWTAQHGMLKLMNPPYVYNVFKDDLDGFMEAIEAAVTTPIDRYVLDRMRLSSIATRLKEFLETDWKNEAAMLLEQRRARGEGPLFDI